MGEAYRVGVVGYSAQRFEEVVARALIVKALDQIEEAERGRTFVLVSGLTDLGVPGLAYREADARGWHTVGVACAKAKEHKLYPVATTVIEGEEWGDESDKFLGMLDALVRVGGGKQSLAEAAEAKKRGLRVIEFELPATAEKK